MSEHRVIIRRCNDYDPKLISKIIKEGMEELGVKPFGNVLLKPNTVIAHPEIFPYAFTRKEFLDGMLEALKETSENIKEISVGERCGITIPTRFCFKNAGYPEVIKKHKAKTYYFDEEKSVPVKLKKEGRLRDRVFIPKSVTKCDFLINLPKFKAHPWTRLTLSLKNFIGIQDDRHRLVDHNIHLEEKIADLQEVVQPKFIAIDGIIAGQKMMLTPEPYPLGAIIMGTNSCAVDTVCCHMVSVNPKDLKHLHLTSQRGFGPMNLDEIEVTGDFPLDEIQKKTKDFAFCMERIDDYFKDHKAVSCTLGKFPEGREYCWGGCPGSLQEAMHIFKGVSPDVEDKMEKVRVVIGKVDKPLNLEKGEKVIFAGDCTSWEGEIDGQKVKIESSYKTKTQVDEGKTKSNDMLLKNFISMIKCFTLGKKRFIHAKGCTISVADQVHYLSFLGKIENPNYDKRLFFGVAFAYLRMKVSLFWNIIRN
ncbi:MAG: DUF362 domain-containing protein [Desulfobacteraceae bacterium]|nr:DUF362 domain-containing protein [Desulfobacteraceae bacterium]